MIRTLGCLVGLMLLTCVLVGCKSEPPQPPPTTTTPDAVDSSWQWPLTDDKLAELRDMPTQKRNRLMRAMTPPTYDVRRTAAPITLDGVLNEPDWTRAAVARTRDAGHGTPAWYGARVRILYDDANLYVAFDCDDADVLSTLKQHDDPLWKEDAVELLIDANADEKGYVEIAASPSGILYDAAWADFHDDVDWFLQPTWERFDLDATLRAYTAQGVKTAVKVKGTLNEAGDTDEGYTIEMLIPFTALRDVGSFETASGKIDMTRAPLLQVKAPEPGTVWRMNFVRDNPSAPLLAEGERSAWSPTGASLHMPCAFGQIRFAAD